MKGINLSNRRRGGIATVALVAMSMMAAPSTSTAAAPAAEQFPTGFMWGTASAGFQTEMGGGAANSDAGTDWWQWVRDPAQKAAKHVSGDLPENGPGSWGDSYAKDIALAKGLGLNTWRMGIEWSRIFPRSTASVVIGDHVTQANLTALDALANQSAVAKYRSIITAARTARMRPFVTLSHFTLPLWVHDPSVVTAAFGSRKGDAAMPSNLTKAGWLSQSTVTEFRKYAAYLAWKFGDLVDWWTPINEPMVVAVGAYANVPGAFASWFPPGLYSYKAALAAVMNLGHANAAAYDEVHAWDKTDSDRDGKASQVGLVQNMIHFTPASPSKSADTKGAVHADKLFNRTFPDAAIDGVYDANANGRVDAGESQPSLAHKADFLGVNYYFQGRVAGLNSPVSTTIPLLDFIPRTGYAWALNPTGANCPTTCSEFGAELDSSGFEAVLTEAASYKLPLIVTENGIADSADSKRPAFLVQHLNRAWKVAKAKPNGVSLLGWFHWSLTDNFEWSAGYRPKFGLFSFSPTTLARTARPSAAIISSIATSNAISSSLLSSWLTSPASR